MAQFSDMELDALQEFINIGTNYAATALSKLIDKTILVTVQKAKIVSLRQIPELLGGAELEIIGLYSQITEDINGKVLLFFSRDIANSLLNLILPSNKNSGSHELDEMEISALMEVGNILNNSYINALSKIMESKIFISVPFYSCDYLSAVIDFLLIEIARAADHVLLMETLIESPDIKLKGNFIVFPDAPSLEKILVKMGLK